LPFAQVQERLRALGLVSLEAMIDAARGTERPEHALLSMILTLETERQGPFVQEVVAALESVVKTIEDDAEARALYAKARLHWERVEPVAESFGDLDPKMDLREADLEKGQEWTGWHRIEKDLWPPKSGYTAMSKTERNKIADQLLSDTKTFETRTKTTTFTADKIANGAKSLMDEVATGKVTGEEEIWSHTDLYDFQGNVDGARIAWENLRPLLKKKDAKLDTSIATKFAALQKLLDKHRVSGSGDDAVFKSYDKLSKAEVKELSDAVNALSEPLSKLTATVTS